MKNYYSLLIMAIMVLFNLSANAQDNPGVTVTISVNNSSMVSVKPYYSPKGSDVTFNPIEFQDNEAVFEFPTSATQRYFYVTPVTPTGSDTVYLLEYTLYNCDDEEIVHKTPNAKTQTLVSIPADADGGKLVINCGPLPPVNLTVNVEGDASKFKLTADGQAKEVTVGSQTLQLPATVSYLMIRPVGVASLASVKYNGEDVKLQSQSDEAGKISYYYSISKPQDNSTLDIVTDYAQVECKVTIDCNEPGFIKSVLVNDKAVDDWSDLKVWLGQRVAVIGNRYDYNVNACGIGSDDDAAEYTSYDLSKLVLDDTRFWFNVSKIERSGQFVLYTQEDTTWSLVNSTASRNSDDDIAPGYHFYGVEPSYDGAFSFSLKSSTVEASESARTFVYVNDLLQDENSNYSLTLSDKDIVKAYFGDSKPAPCRLTYVISDLEGTPEITHDFITAVTNPATHSVLPGTRVAFKAALDGEEIKRVKVNDEAVEPVDGEYCFYVNSDSEVKISGKDEEEEDHSGILDVECEQAAAGVYNLQGIRIDSKAGSLPAGIYIVNGKKTRVK